VTITIKRYTPITQYTNLPSLIFSGVGKKHSRSSDTLPPTPDPKSKDISSPSFPDKNQKKRQKHQSRDKKDLVCTEKTAQKQKIDNTSYQKNTFSCYTINIQGLTEKKWTALLAHPVVKDPDAIIITDTTSHSRKHRVMSNKQDGSSTQFSPLSKNINKDYPPPHPVDSAESF